jgi:hypothetical protein
MIARPEIVYASHQQFSNTRDVQVIHNQAGAEDVNCPRGFANLVYHLAVIWDTATCLARRRSLLHEQTVRAARLARSFERSGSPFERSAASLL